MRGVKYGILLLLVFVCSAANAASNKPPLSIQILGDFTISKGHILYQRYCLFCHGESGKGDGQNAFSLSKRPADFTLTLPRPEKEKMGAVIRQGGEKNNLSHDMPSFSKTLSDKQITLLVEYIQAFSETE